MNWKTYFKRFFVKKFDFEAMKDLHAASDYKETFTIIGIVNRSQIAYIRPNSIINIGSSISNITTCIPKERVTCLDLLPQEVPYTFIQADIRTYQFGRSYDLALMLNVLYYFTKKERKAILNKLPVKYLLVSYNETNFVHYQHIRTKRLLREFTDYKLLSHIQTGRYHSLLWERL